MSTELGRKARRDDLIDILWADASDVRLLENRLDRTVSALRRALEPTLKTGVGSSCVLTKMEGYSLNPAVSWWVDSEEFSKAYDEARTLQSRGEHSAALCVYEKAKQLCQGDYLVDCSRLDRS